MGRGSYKKLAILALIMALVSPFARIAAGSDLTRVYSVSVQFRSGDNYRKDLPNFQAALTRLQTFLDSTKFQKGAQYSFINNALGIVYSQNGSGDGVNAAASLLNRLVHQTLFWDSDGVQKPVFE